MTNKIVRFSLLVFSFFLFLNAEATHNRAGEITIAPVTTDSFTLRYKITIVTYTEIGAQADRPLLLVDFGDGTSDSVPRLSIQQITPQIQKNIYCTFHTFPAQGIYTVSVNDPNRNAGSQNIPNSVNIPFHIESMFVINPKIVPNTPLVLLNPPIDFGCVGKLFVHNPNAFDADGDSIAFELIDCLGANGLPIPLYSLPPGNITLDAKTGQFVWDSPQSIGEFNFCILVKEYRDGVLIGTVLRDMQVSISACPNDPPEIAFIADTCVKSGQLLKITVVATDVNNDRIVLSANGGPFEFMNNQANFTQLTNTPGRATGEFTWTPDCDNIRNLPYQVLFKAEDLPPIGNPSLVDLHPWGIKVIGPPPTLLSADSKGGVITINWDNSTTCNSALGYRIYRKQGGPSGFVPGACQTGVPSDIGYQLIDEVSGFNTTTYDDDNKGQGLASGVEYCYMITALFETSSRNPANRPESCASNELCNIVKRDLPVITRVDVENTGLSDGRIRIEWAKPTELDTVQFPGPYKYELYRSPGFQIDEANKTLVQTFTSSTFSGLVDSFFIDQNINTLNTPQAYQLQFYFNGNQEVGIVKSASSVFLSINPLPMRLQLNWAFDVNWTNDSFFVYREDLSGTFQQIAIVTNQSYTDLNLIDGETYCYYVESVGRFHPSTNLPQRIFNRSQIACGFPRDTVPPCAPELSVNPDCDALENTLTWFHPDTTCIADLAYYKIYYAPFIGQELQALDSVLKPQMMYVDVKDRISIAGCYAVVSVDSSLNESIFSNIVCVDNCPDYKLPNVFTPNGDNFNDLFTPFPSYRFVDQIDLQVYNRWGQKVFSTKDPAINWDGKNEFTKADCSAGVYYYTIEIFDLRLNGLEIRNEKGIIRLIR